MTAIYVQYGCGFCVGKDWLNFDSSPTLRIERMPALGRLLGRMSGNAQRFPAAVRYGDICKGLPVADNSVQGIFASHVLEHLAYDDFNLALRNTFRILKPGGVFRLIVPDLEARARRYVQAVAAGAPEASLEFLRASHLGIERRPRSLLGRMRLLFGGSAHLWMWDEPSMVSHLASAGFADIRRCEFGDCHDAMFAQVEEYSRFVDVANGAPELAIAARKPEVDQVRPEGP
jgi:SAM-dependent methyltransferase